MNLKEAKAHALETLKLERDFVRTFGKLTATQTWRDAIAAADAVAEFDAQEEASAAPEAEATSVAEEMTAAPESAEASKVSAEELETLSVLSQHPEKVVEDSFIAFWEAEPDPILPQPLDSLPELDVAWGDASKTATPAPVAVYPMVILLLMLWALVQMLLLGGKALCWVLAKAGQWLDDLAQAQLEHCRESIPEPPSRNLALAAS